MRSFFFFKFGFWKIIFVKMVCNGCFFVCEMNIEVYDGMFVRVLRVEEGWNGYFCDVCCFMRFWVEDLVGLFLNGEFVSWEEVRRFIVERDYVFIFILEFINEEIVFFKEFVEKCGIFIGLMVEGGFLIVIFEDIRKVKCVFLKVDFEKYLFLKFLLKDKDVVEEDYEVVIFEGLVEFFEVLMFIFYEGVNVVGFIRVGIVGILESKVYVVIGRVEREFDGDVLVFFVGFWVVKEGIIINVFGMELEVKKVVEGYFLLEFFF